ncbi:thioredoxin-like domain-containing protein [Variovorax paradoxus B4]|uniref:Thiol-disulfide oxidoreductase YkuV n=2 Tax=Variovorax paradoxus TaxID=34073 RepID=A0A0H2LYG9_VARPD|nr:thioredoxin family protein [Variovorax paradoxus]AGU51673.1 thioredoxin-like domain-containing protein [Variovorax paradoxus B4]KLN54836.1 thiol-disulfide oxidoreductase YkuV [Variovorax paradoxus]
MKLFRIAIGAAIAASVGALTFAAPQLGGHTPADVARPAPEFRNIDTWLNSPPLKLQELRGQVVLVDFWTYTCINCLNHLPYVQQWHEKYKDKGLTVVGVHTPEFAFEKSTRNVRDAIQRLQIRHAVAQDNSYGTWKAFNNQYWPAVYLIDKEGRIAYSHFGEGSYAATEKKIQALLAGPFPAAAASGAAK